MRKGLISLFAFVMAGCGSSDVLHRGNPGDLPVIAKMLILYGMPVVELSEEKDVPTFQVYLNDPKTPWAPDVQFTYDLESHVLKTVSCVEPETCKGLRKIFAPYQLKKIFKNIYLSDSDNTPYFVLFFDDSTTVPSPDVGVFYNQITSEFESVCYYDAEGNLFRYDPATNTVYQSDYNVLEKEK